MLKIKNLTYKIKEKEILRNINLEFESGKFYSIVGPNGGGKTTLLKAIARINSDLHGEILLEGKNINSYKANEFAKRLSYVPQNTYINGEFTCFETVLMGRYYAAKSRFHESREDNEIALNAMKKTKTHHLRDENIKTISGGERQRIILSRSIAQDSNIILLDEPLAHLDIKHQIATLKILKEYKTLGKTVIMVIHDLNFALNFSDEIILINNGEVFSKGEATHVLTSENIKSVYDVDSHIVEEKGKRYLHFNME